MLNSMCLNYTYFPNEYPTFYLSPVTTKKDFKSVYLTLTLIDSLETLQTYDNMADLYVDCGNPLFKFMREKWKKDD